jgi:1,4-alpha-glucan branching enzyme
MVKSTAKEKKVVQVVKAVKAKGFFERISDVKPLVKKDKAVKFIYFAPHATSVSVAGSFNEWSKDALRLTGDRAGQWTGSVTLNAGTYEYRFLVDGQWADDPQATKTVVNAFGEKNAVLEVK